MVLEVPLVQKDHERSLHHVLSIGRLRSVSSNCELSSESHTALVHVLNRLPTLVQSLLLLMEDMLPSEVMDPTGSHLLPIHRMKGLRPRPPSLDHGTSAYIYIHRIYPDTTNGIFTYLGVVDLGSM